MIYLAYRRYKKYAIEIFDQELYDWESSGFKVLVKIFPSTEKKYGGGE